jgi:hypothetical protein
MQIAVEYLTCTTSGSKHCMYSQHHLLMALNLEREIPQQSSARWLAAENRAIAEHR